MKKLLLSLLPRKILDILIKRKYKKEFFQIHKNNTEQSRVVTIDLNDQETKTKLNNILTKMCVGTYKKYNVYFMPIATIEAQKGYEHYLKILNSNARSKVKRASKKGINCQAFIWNDHLEDIFEINCSSQTRQGRKMDDEYLSPPSPITINDSNDFKIRHIGAFYESKLVGYIELYIYNNFCMTNRLLGHKNHQNKYIMNALFAYNVIYAIENDIDYINYLTMTNKTTNSLSSFKNRLGFREYSLKIIE